MTDVRLLTPEALAQLEYLESEANRTHLSTEAYDGREEAGEAGDRFIEALDKHAKALLLAHRLLPQMAQALEYLEGADDMPDWVEEYVRAVLKPYRAAQGTAEEAADA